MRERQGEKEREKERDAPMEIKKRMRKRERQGEKERFRERNRFRRKVEECLPINFIIFNLANEIYANSEKGFANSYIAYLYLQFKPADLQNFNLKQTVEIFSLKL